MIVNQPHDEQLGIQLIKALESNQFNQLTIMVAYLEHLQVLGFEDYH